MIGQRIAGTLALAAMLLWPMPRAPRAANAHAVARPLALMLQVPGVNINQMTPEQQLEFQREEQQFELQREALGHNPWGQVADMLIPIAAFATFAVIFWLGFRHRQAQVQAQAELRRHMLDKFGTGAELAAFLESKGGQQFLEELKSHRRAPGRRFFGGLYAGVITTMLGLAFLGLALGGRRRFVEAAVILLALGVGFLISAAISHHLSKTLDQNRDQNAGPGASATDAPIV